MTELSLQAQAVLDAVCDNTEPDCDTQHLIAAALRAVAAIPSASAPVPFSYKLLALATELKSMKYVAFCSFALLLGQLALAQGTPVPKVGGSCPTGTYSSSGSCVPNSNTQVYYKGGGPCPLGWTSSKGYCVR